MSKDVIIFPYINITKIIKMDDFEIHPFSDYNLKEELEEDDIPLLNDFIDSFRETLFSEWKIPEKANWIGILKYKWTILRINTNSKDIWDKVKILFLLLKLHISIDSFNQWMSIIDVRVFEYFQFNFSNDYTNKFWNMWKCKTLHSTIPENIKWLKEITFLPLHYSLNNIPVTFNIVSNSEDFFWIDKNTIDMTYLFEWINTNTEYYKKFLNLSSIHYWLEQQNDLFFYYSIIPTILEVLLYPIDISDSKKQKALDYWKKIDELVIKDNDIIETIIYIKRNWIEVKDNIWLIARTIVSIYDMRNDLLHEGKKSFDKMKVSFKWNDLKIYDVFQLIFKYSILNDFIEKWIIKNEFIKLVFEWDIFYSWNIKISGIADKLYMDDKLSLLMEKAKSDKEIAADK